MSRLIHTLSVFGLALVLGSVALAEDKKDAKKDTKKPAAEPYANVFSFPKQITLTAEQKTKLADLKKEYTPKLAEADKKIAGIMTAERKKSAEEASKKAKADGKKGKELQEAVNSALNLSKDEQAQLKECNQSKGKLTAEIKKKMSDLLTAEQKEQAKPKKPAPKK